MASVFWSAPGIPPRDDAAASMLHRWKGLNANISWFLLIIHLFITHAWLYIQYIQRFMHPDIFRSSFVVALRFRWTFQTKVDLCLITEHFLYGPKIPLTDVDGTFSSLKQDPKMELD